MSSYIELSHVEKSFFARNSRKIKTVKAVNDISFRMEKGDSLGIIGTSGCGKTTILKMIMGLEKQDKGSITVCGRLGFVAQDPYASLDPSMPIYQIIAEPLIFSGKRHSYKNCEAEVSRVMAYVHLDVSKYGARLPSQLSGGERQRVSIARALILEPDLLILDEPTSMLDQEVKESITDLIRGIAKSGKFGFLMVTHDISMSARVCENLLVMSEGKIVEQGKTADILESPQSSVTKILIEVATDVKKFWGK